MPSGIYVRTKATREAIRRSRIGTKSSTETRAKLSSHARAQACDVKWRKRVSVATRKAMHRPEVRRKHLRGLKKAQKEHGVNFTTFGRDLVVFEKEFAKILCPLGYVQQHYVKAQGRQFYLDFALIEQKIAIECDGPKHRSFKQQKYDRARDAKLKSLGWKVIRVLHV